VNKEVTMGIGVGLLLILVGAIMKFAITARPTGVNLDAFGVVLMVLGVLYLCLTLVLYQRGRTAVTRRRVYGGSGVPDQEVVEERRMYDEPPM
jgi:Domain of unknown function (DUF6458)